MDWQIECSRDLVLAILRLAVSDYLGIAYGHDDPLPTKQASRNHCYEAESFLKSPWCAYLSDLVGLPRGRVWREALLVVSTRPIELERAA
jgi:hypothetical protein